MTTPTPEQIEAEMALAERVFSEMDGPRHLATALATARMEGRAERDHDAARLIARLTIERDRLTAERDAARDGGRSIDSEDMSAAENVLVWLCYGKLKRPDDMPLTPDDALALLSDMIDQAIRYEDDIKRLKAERDEADRRAGAAARQMADMQDTITRRQTWLFEAKREWGVDDNISFDVVWKEALAFKERAITAERERDEALAKVERMDAALAEYECNCTGFCQAEKYGGPCGRLAVATRAARKEPT